MREENKTRYRECKVQLRDLQGRVDGAASPILTSLAFEEIHYRLDKIPRAYAETFEWSFDPSATQFPAWAKRGSGIFWVTGKAGSGKSTLMKYLSTHSATEELLKRWAAPKHLVTASHYFWIVGTPLQKSQAGLLRSLLYQILEKCPELAPTATPLRYANKSAQDLPWKEEELVKALLAIANQRALSTCFCFFIDGLDEYEGEHSQIIEILSNLTSSPYVKICAASRPWNVFQNAYNQDPETTLTMQDLTKRDIEHYILGTLRANPQFRHLEKQDVGPTMLVGEVIEKAQGVFLWVHLVVRNLLAGLAEGDDIDILRARVEEFPPTLEEYFRRMLDSVHKVYRKQTSRILLSAMNWEGDLPSSTPAHICAEIADPNYAWTMPILKGGPRNPSEAEKTRKHLNARCRDLLELNTGGKIGFLHRTVIDFLETNDIHVRLVDNAGSEFDPCLANLKVIVAVLKSTSTDYSQSVDLWNHLSRFQSNFSQFQLNDWDHIEEDTFSLLLKAVMTSRKSGNWDVVDTPGGLEAVLDLSDPDDLVTYLRTVCRRLIVWEAVSSAVELDNTLDLSNSSDVIVCVRTTSSTIFDRNTVSNLSKSLRPICISWTASTYRGVFLLLEKDLGDSTTAGGSFFSVLRRMEQQELQSGLDQAFTALAQALLIRLPPPTITHPP